MSASRRCLREEGGFTLIEVVVAALVLALTVVAVSILFVTGDDSSLATQRESEVISVADQQIEKIRAEVKTDGFGALAMSGAPQAMSSPPASYSSTIKADPYSFVESSSGCGLSNEGYLIEANYDDSSGGSPQDPQSPSTSGVLPWYGCQPSSSPVAEPLEILSGGFVTPQQTNVAVGSDTATVDTFVTDTYVGCNSALGSCPSTSGSVVGSSSTPCTWPTSTSVSTPCADARRVTVAVVINDHNRYTIGPSAPVYVSTVFTDPVPANQPQSATVGISLGAQLG